MKKTFLKSIFAFAVICGTYSCSTDDDPIVTAATCTDGIQNGDETGVDCGGICEPCEEEPQVLEGDVLTGDITGDLLVESGDYLLRGAVSVKNGATLTIEPGTTFTVSAADQAAGVNLLFVEQGGKIFAEGTAEEPIVFTSENKNSEGGDGDWGGIGIHGRATINAPGGESISEAGQLPYGGDDDQDSSGVLKYVRVEYAGQASSDGQFEFNAFSFFAVGSGTVLENLEAFEGADDGFEFYGGAVDVTNLSAVGMEDDSVDWDEGFHGSINNLVIYQYDNVGDFAFELANRSGENNASPRSLPVLTDVTVRGNAIVDQSAIDIKQGTGGIFTNLIVTNTDIVFSINDQVQEVLNGDFAVIGGDFEYMTALFANNVDGSVLEAEDFIVFDENATGADRSVFEGWTNYANL